MWSHQSADVFLTVPFNSMHLILVLLVSSAQIHCFGLISLQSIGQSLLSLFPGCLLFLNLKYHTQHNTTQHNDNNSTVKKSTKKVTIYKHTSNSIKQL